MVVSRSKQLINRRGARQILRQTNEKLEDSIKMVENQLDSIQDEGNPVWWVLIYMQATSGKHDSSCRKKSTNITKKHSSFVISMFQKQR